MISPFEKVRFAAGADQESGEQSLIDFKDRKASDRPGVSMKTHGQVEAAICEGLARFEQQYMGRGPKNSRAHLIGDLVLVRLQGVLTEVEQQLVKTVSPEKGRDLLKEVRTQLIETARPVLEAMIEEITGVKSVSLHHDISTVTGEKFVLFVLSQTPACREKKRKLPAGT